MPLEPIIAAIQARMPKFRTGLDVGFADGTVVARLHERFPALWMSSKGGRLPYEGNQFDVAVLNGEAISQESVREIHRVLNPAGCLFFTVVETVRHGPACTLSQLYNAFLKSGYDIVTVTRPPWWRFGRDGKTLTVCARKKNWRETRPLRFVG